MAKSNAANSPALRHARAMRSIAGGLMLASAVGALLVGLFLLRTHYSVGYAAFDVDKMEDVRAIINLILSSYDNAISLATAGFGAIAFLVTFQQKQRTNVTNRAWALLGAGLVFLASALVLSLLGREVILLMITRNAVDLSVPMLTYGRWFGYSSIVLAAILVSFFAIEVTVAEPAPEK
jgi:hypothetical protein